MKTVAVVCEYNPFHLGHAHQIREIRKAFGEATAVIAIMSGNYVQRGEPAILGKFDRAAAAVLAGASLVLELPFPYCIASAEYFSLSAVSIAKDLGAIDVLSFGSECGNIDTLHETVARIESPEFKAHFKKKLASKEEKSKGYARLLSEAFEELYAASLPISLSLPNNILAISYLSALRKLDADILPHTIPRMGTDADGEGENVFAGASYIRSLLLSERREEAYRHLPQETHAVWQRAIESGRAPACAEHIAPLLLGHLRLADASACSLFAECNNGVFPLLKKSALAASDHRSLIEGAVTKKYTASRLRRAILFSYLGVTPAHLKSRPLYTQVLAMDEKGKAVLAHIRKTATISILTKPADLHKLSSAARAQAELSYRADSVYALASPVRQRADSFLRTSPYRK